MVGSGGVSPRCRTQHARQGNGVLGQSVHHSMTSWVYGCRAAMVGSGGISALVSALQDGSMCAKAAASRLLLGFAAEGPDAQEWIAAAPGAIAALVDLLR